MSPLWSWILLMTLGAGVILLTLAVARAAGREDAQMSAEWLARQRKAVLPLYDQDEED